MKVLVLGATGMLGSAVATHFLEQKGYEVYMTYRNPDVILGGVKISDYENARRFDPLADDFSSLPEADYVFNCIGTTKPFMTKSPVQSVLINSIVPRQLAGYYSYLKDRFIHISTDCVFSGKDGAYTESSPHDALDDYGKSKSLGEPVDDCMVIRTSIIGNEIHKDASLVAWVKSMSGKKAQGWTRHKWNGVTTDQYAKCLQQIIENDLYEKGLFHIHSNTVNKYELVSMIADRYSVHVELEEVPGPNSVDRTLSSEKDLCKKLDIPSIQAQVRDMR